MFIFRVNTTIYLSKEKVHCPNVERVCNHLLIVTLVLQIPNGFGCGLGALQLILYAIYRDNKGEQKKATTDGSMEMGLGNGKNRKEELSKMDQHQNSNV